MNNPNPQEAFFSWLAQSLARALAAMGGPDSDVAYLSGAIDHADLERRMRTLRHAAPSPLAALTHHHS